MKLIHGLLGAAMCLTAAASEPKVIADQSYATADAKQKLDLYLPQPQPKDSPLLLFIHGGAWTSGDRKDIGLVGQTLAGHGVSVALMSYRLSGNGTLRHPEHLRDVIAAYTWLENNAARLGWKGKRLFVGGFSAGAFLSAALATSPDFRPRTAPTGFLGLAGIYNLPLIHKRHPDYKNWFLEAAFGPEVNWAGASPEAQALRQKGRWLLIFSPQDELVDAEQSHLFRGKLQEAKLPARLLSLPNRKHVEVLQALTSKDKPLSEVLRFLK